MTLNSQIIKSVCCSRIFIYNPYYLDADANTQAKYQIHGQLDNRGQGVSVDIKDDRVTVPKLMI